MVVVYLTKLSNGDEPIPDLRNSSSVNEAMEQDTSVSDNVPEEQTNLSEIQESNFDLNNSCLLYTSPSPRAS